MSDAQQPLPGDTPNESGPPPAGVDERYTNGNGDGNGGNGGNGNGEGGVAGPGSTLEELRTRLITDEAANQEQLAKLEGLRAQVAALEKAVVEIDPIIKGYEAAAQPLREQAKDLQDYAGTKKKALEAIPNLPHQKITARRTKSLTDITQLRTRIHELTSDVKKQTDALAAADAEVTKAQGNADREKDLLKRNAAWNKFRLDLQSRAEKEDEKQNYGRMYYLLLEIMGNEVFPVTELPPEAEYRKRVEDAVLALNKAQQARSDATASLKKTQSELAGKQKELDRLTKIRVDTDLNAIGDGISGG